jgi:hypothetical protein
MEYMSYLCHEEQVKIFVSMTFKVLDEGSNDLKMEEFK